MRFHFFKYAVLAAVFVSAPVLAHDYKSGGIKIDHPYATPGKTGSKTGMVFFRSISNNAAKADTLLSVTTPKSKGAYIFNPEGKTTVVLAERSKVLWRHDAAGSPHIMLPDLDKPLQVGERFPIILKFQNAGELKVDVWVQQLKTATAHQH